MYLKILIFLCLYIKYGCALICYWNTACPYKFLGSKTSYSAVRNDIRDSVVKLTGCEPVSIWGLVRHGKITPGVDDSANMKKATVIKEAVISSYDKGNSSLCAQDVDNLRQWTLDNKIFEKPQQLTDEGAQDVQALGSRLKHTFSKLLTKLDTESYTFRRGHGHRLKDTATAFVNGLQSQDVVIEKAREDFDILAPHKTCKKYQSEVMDHHRTYEETKKYHDTAEYLTMTDRVHRRTGVNFTISDENITVLYDWCRYTWSGIDNKMSPWCALFTTEDLKVLEYANDMNHFYKNGYGTPLTKELGKLPLADLLKNFQDAKEGKGKKIVVYFTHGAMIEMVFTSLNLFKDDRLLTGVRRDPERKWRNSHFSPYSSNLLTVLHRCGQENDYKVVFYLNEKPLIQICKDGVCTWQEFEDILKSFSSDKPDYC